VTVGARKVKSAHGWLTWFWVANVPPVAVLYFTLDPDAFQRVMIPYLVIVSIWANVASHATGWVAGRADVAVEEGQ